MFSDLAPLLPHLPGLLLLAVILTVAVKLAPYLEKGRRNDFHE